MNTRKSHVRGRSSATRRARQRGMAMLLVLLALTLASVLSIGFLLSQDTSLGVARNIAHGARARGIAESGMTLTMRYIEQSSAWRTDKPHGAWFENHPLGGGSYTVTVEDGQDTDGDGVVDGDGDLADDPTEVATVTVIGRFAGVAHRVQAVVTSGSILSGPINLLMIVGDVDALTASESARKEMIEGWGWQVELLSGDSTAAQYTEAMADMHVVYVPRDGGSNLVGLRLVSCELGVVTEDGDTYKELGIAVTRKDYSGRTVKVVDNTHYITSPFAIGDLTIGTANRTIEAPHAPVAGSARPLAWWPGTENRVVAAMEVGSPLVETGSAAGRRAVSPFAGFQPSDMTDNGKMLLKRMLEWGAQSGMSTDTVTALNDWTNSTTVNLVAGEDRLLVVCVGAETHASITSISYGNQELTLASYAYESTGVGCRSYLYYLREASLQAASDNRIRMTWTSGSRSDTSVGVRLYANVNQASPLRTTEWMTNAGPPTIACAPVAVTKGDVVVSVARVGHENRSYTWDSPLVRGVNDRLSTSSMSTADYAVDSGVTTVTAAATCSAPNRQAMVTAVLQPRSRASGGGKIPQLLALYQFQEQAPEARLVGHWPLDDDGSGGCIAVQSDFDMFGSSRIEGYRSTQGAFGGSNAELPVTLVTNTGNSSGIYLRNNATLVGSTYNRPGANPTNVVSIGNSAAITGNRYEQSVAFALPGVSAPSGMPSSQGNVTINSNRTVNTDQTFSTLTLTGGTITVSGDVRIWCTNDFTMSGGRIVINSGSRLRIYVYDDVSINGSAVIHSDTTSPQRLELYTYGGSGSEVTLQGDASVCGVVYARGRIRMYDESRISGAVATGSTLYMEDIAAIRVDLDMPGFGIVPVADATGLNRAEAHGGVSFDQDGARAFTGRSLAFDGTNDFVRIAHHDAYLLDHGTVSFWFRSESLWGGRGLFSKESASYDTGGHLHIYTQSNTLYARLQTNGTYPYGSTNDFEVSVTGLGINTWYHVAVTFGAGGLRLYRPCPRGDNVIDTLVILELSLVIVNYQAIVLGAASTHAGDLTHLPLNSYFQGRMDDVRVFESVLDASQIDRVYTGQEPGDRTEPSYLVVDSSGLGEPVNLSVDNTQAVEWTEDGLKIKQATTIRSAKSPDKVRNGVTATGEFTVEFIVSPQSNSQTGRLFWYGPNTTTDTNLDVYQSGGNAVARLRTSDTASSPPGLNAVADLSATRQHMLVTYDGTALRVYKDGGLVAEQQMAGSLLAWDTTYRLTLASLPQGSSGWLGTYERVAIYDRAMNARQRDNLVQSLPPGDGAGEQGAFTVRWAENP